MHAKHTLTGNDLALAGFACSLAMSWWKDRPASGFKRKEIAKYKALNSLLTEIGDHAYPIVHDAAGEILDHGDEPIMKLDTVVVARSRKALTKAARQ